MCEPTTLAVATLAITAASEGANLTAQNQAGKAQTAYQQQLVVANNAETSNQLSALRIQQAQANESTARETEKARRASLAAKSTAMTAAGDAGASGQSVDAMLQEYSANLGQFKEATTRQKQLQGIAYEDQAAAILSGARATNLQLNAPVTGANYAASALRIGSSALGAYKDYNPSAFRKAPTPKPAGGKT